MKRALIVLAVIFTALLACGCCSGCGIFDPDIKRTIYADDLDNPSNNSTVFGVWSSSNASVADPGIAFLSGNGPPDGQWYMVREDGYFKYTKIYTEDSARGGIFRMGRASVEGDRIYLSEINESYYPGPNSRLSSYNSKAIPDESLTFVMPDNDALVINGDGIYHRLYR